MIAGPRESRTWWYLGLVLFVMVCGDSDVISTKENVGWERNGETSRGVKSLSGSSKRQLVEAVSPEKAENHVSARIHRPLAYYIDAKMVTLGGSSFRSDRRSCWS